MDKAVSFHFDISADIDVMGTEKDCHRIIFAFLQLGSFWPLGDAKACFKQDTGDVNM